jgi:acyl dehydratase
MSALTREQRYFDDAELGDEFEEEYVATSERVATYLAVSRGNAQLDEEDGRFSDASGAQALGLERPIVPGVMSLSIITRLVTDWVGPAGRLRTLDASFRRPVLHGDRLRLLALVTDATDESGVGRVTLDVYLENERGERPLQGVAVVELPHRPR